MSLTTLLVEPFAEYGFMRRALIATFAVALGSAPIGTLLVLRRMSLVGDAMAHALLPGAALGFIVAGFSMWAMSAGGFAAALSVALAAGWVTRATAQREDASFAAFYLIALALGVLLVSTHGSSVDLMHVLFGSILAVDDAALLLMAAAASVTLLALAAVYRPLEVVFIGRDMDRDAIEQAWKAMHLNYTETRKGALSMKGWRDLPDPFPQWQRSSAEMTA